MFFHNLDYAYWDMSFSANISGPEEMSLGMPVEEQIAMLNEAIDRQPDFKDSFYITLPRGIQQGLQLLLHDGVTVLVLEDDLISTSGLQFPDLLVDVLLVLGGAAAGVASSTQPRRFDGRVLLCEQDHLPGRRSQAG